METTLNPHLALCLPEIISHIFSFLVPAHTGEELKKKMYVDLYPCLIVNRLWHDNSSRIIWRKAFFEDTKDDLDTFLKFASVIYNASSTSSINNTINYLSEDRVWNKKIISADSRFAEEMDNHYQSTLTKLDTAARLTTYRNALRYLCIRKIKEKSVNEPLSRIGEHASKLEHLDIYICDHFSNEALYPFLAHQSLTYLSLAGCHNITDEAILKVAEYCKRLEHLDLRACGLVSDVSLSAIALNCPRLRHLNVGRIRDREKVSMKSIALIAEFTQAAVLGLAGCDIDDGCMQVLAKYRTTGLERVSVNSCFKISNETVYAYIRYCPNLSVFEMKECHQVNDWEAVAELVNRKVLLTLCDQQNRACADWARIRGRTLDVKAPLK
ncbi:uncharacterized protein EV154DRAFT_466558 [Mucor mucedo]|uniref:uncharacterized protein n=1 Tax=Mucor mucedo TaxID=29922 RepID=UPI0022209293|nr:uncharacterized protein EV154DRAFT_466558 [Mucor mucedo]KAI7889858.1 hypothetical protein EV154DRAFT_466558 [Mucor mucedo]